MQAAQTKIFNKLDEIGKDVSDICGTVGVLKTSVNGVTTEQDRLKKTHPMQAAPLKDPLKGEPVGYLNNAMRKVFNSPAFWVFVAWFCFKIVVFGELPQWWADKQATVKSVVTQMQKK
jgi:hypothetical protein